MKPEDALEHAAAQIRERGVLRENPGGERSMARTVAAFNGLLGGDRRLTEAEGWLFMCCLKMARGTAGAPHPDDAIDLASYAALWGECVNVPKPGTITEVDDLIGGWHTWDCHQTRADLGPKVPAGYYVCRIKTASDGSYEMQPVDRAIWDDIPPAGARIVAYCLERMP